MFSTIRALMLSTLLLGLGLAVAQPPTGKDMNKDKKDAEKKDTDKTKDGTPDETRVNVPITTPDGAELAGTYFRGPKGAESPCAILVHRWGADRAKNEWNGLAR